MTIIAFVFFLAIVLYGFYFFTRQNKVRDSHGSETVNSGLLEQHVAFYRNLDEVAKKDFEDDIRFFLSHTKITAVDTSLEELDKLLVASAAVIPIFYFKKWRYYNLKEVLLYSDTINMKFETKGNQDRNILGMVGEGVYNNMMFLSKHALRSGFSITTDKHNTAIHEFVHLIDKADGDTDGIPETLLDKRYVMPWIELIHEGMQRIAQNKSDIHDYAFTNKAEFFAVAAEYFFERPDLLEENHPELFGMLTEMFETKNRRNVREDGI